MHIITIDIGYGLSYNENISKSDLRSKKEQQVLLWKENRNDNTVGGKRKVICIFVKVFFRLKRKNSRRTLKFLF